MTRAPVIVLDSFGLGAAPGIVDRLGDAHVRTGCPIGSTSSDSVFTVDSAARRKRLSWRLRHITFAACRDSP